jgi:hypothetical protein
MFDDLLEDGPIFADPTGCPKNFGGVRVWLRISIRFMNSICEKKDPLQGSAR